MLQIILTVYLCLTIDYKLFLLRQMILRSSIAFISSLTSHLSLLLSPFTLFIFPLQLLQTAALFNYQCRLVLFTILLLLGSQLLFLHFLFGNRRRRAIIHNLKLYKQNRLRWETVLLTKLQITIHVIFFCCSCLLPNNYHLSWRMTGLVCPSTTGSYYVRCCLYQKTIP